MYCEYMCWFVRIIYIYIYIYTGNPISACLEKTLRSVYLDLLNILFFCYTSLTVFIFMHINNLYDKEHILRTFFIPDFFTRPLLHARCPLKIILKVVFSLWSSI